MNNGYIAILDSGIGGFSCLAQAAKRLGCERFLYFGDNKNAPYGNKTKAELYALMRKNLAEIFKYDVKAVIVGCNTLSVSVLPLVAPAYKQPFFGVYPPIEEKRGKTFLFATPVTCARYAKSRKITVFPLKDLAADIERNKNDLSKVDINKHVGGINETFADTLILGCTHYFFVKQQFIDHFCPHKVVSGEEFTAKRLKRYLVRSGNTSKNKEFTVDFIGENAEENYNFYCSVVKKIIFGK